MSRIGTSCTSRRPQRADPLVLLLSGLQAGHLRAADHQRVAQGAVLFGQAAVGARGAACAVADATGQAGQPPHRLHRHLAVRAQLAQPSAAMVQHHQRDRGRQVREQPQRPGDIAGT
jgi:hypothetical protein